MTANIHFKYYMHGTSFPNNVLEGIRGVFADDTTVTYSEDNVVNLLPYTDYLVNDFPNFEKAGFTHTAQLKFMYYRDLGNDENTWSSHMVKTYVSNQSYNNAFHGGNNTKTLSDGQTTKAGYGWWINTVGYGNSLDYGFATNKDIYILVEIDSYPNSNNWYYPNAIFFDNIDLYNNASVTDNHKPNNIYRWVHQKANDNTHQYSLYYPLHASDLTLNLKSDKQLYLHDLANSTYTKIDKTYPLKDIDASTWDNTKVITDSNGETPVTPPAEKKTADVSINSGNFTLVNAVANKIEVGTNLDLQLYANPTYTIDFTKSNITYTDKNDNQTTINLDDKNKNIFTRSDSTKAVGLKYSLAINEGSYEINIVTKEVEYTIDYSAVKHIYMTVENPNLGIDTKLTHIKADTDYTVKFHKDKNWIFNSYALNINGTNHLKSNYDGTYKLSAISPADFDGASVSFTANEIDNTPKPIEYSNIKIISDYISVSPEKVELNKTTTITVTADSNHVLTPADPSNETLANGYYKYGENGDEKHNFYISTDHKTATAQVRPTTTDDIIVSCETKISNQSENDRPKIPIKLNLTNCKADITELPENTDEEWSAGNLIEKTITLTADDGYIFDKDIIYYTYGLNEGIYVKDTQKANNESTITIQMLAGAKANYIKDNLNYEPSIIAVAHLKVEPISKGLDSIHIYHMRNAELDNLSNNIIKYVQNHGETSELTSYDYTKFINQVYRLPFAIPADIETETEKVSAGLYNLSMKTHKITSDFYDIDVGSIEVPADDSTSYNALKATLYLPYINSVDLSINDIVGNTIKITYRINLLNGINTLIIENDNGILLNQNVNVSTSLQIFGTYYDKTINSLNSVLNNNLRQAYLVISRKEPIKNLETYPTNEHGFVKDYNGLTKFANTRLQLDATYQEKQEILSQLENGVYIK